MGRVLDDLHNSPELPNMGWKHPQIGTGGADGTAANVE
jgi:hypothetical protein